MEFVQSASIPGVYHAILKFHQDERGSLAEMFRIDEGPEIRLRMKENEPRPYYVYPEQGYVSWTHAGKQRGPHEHKEQTDFFVFPGPGEFSIYLWDNRGGDPKQASEKCLKYYAGQSKAMALIVPPGVVHGYKNISNYLGLVLNFPNRLYAGWERKMPVDEIRHESDQNSPFKME